MRARILAGEVHGGHNVTRGQIQEVRKGTLERDLNGRQLTAHGEARAEARHRHRDAEANLALRRLDPDRHRDIRTPDYAHPLRELKRYALHNLRPFAVDAHRLRRDSRDLANRRLLTPDVDCDQVRAHSHNVISGFRHSRYHRAHRHRPAQRRLLDRYTHRHDPGIKYQLLDEVPQVVAGLEAHGLVDGFSASLDVDRAGGLCHERNL